MYQNIDPQFVLKSIARDTSQHLRTRRQLRVARAMKHRRET